MNRRRATFIIAMIAAALAVAGAIVFRPEPTQAQAVPKYDVDLAWPKPFPANRWLFGAIGGICVDAQDHLFMMNRDTVAEYELDAGIIGPPVLELDAEGAVVHTWGDRNVLPMTLHGCTVDKDNNVWIIGTRKSAQGRPGFAQKYSHDGSKILQQVGRDDLQIEEIAIDRNNGDVYFAISGENPGVAVFSGAGQFLRQWKLQRSPAEKDLRLVVHGLTITNDGFLYIGDRRAYRVQEFDRMGNFKRNIDVPWKQYTPVDAPLSAGVVTTAKDGKRVTGIWGSASTIAASRDANQRFLYVTNEDNSQVDVIDRQSGKVVSSLGRGNGHFPGQFTHAHGLAIDSRGIVYVGEVGEGKRVQRFKPVR